jgi:hypothetical protein
MAAEWEMIRRLALRVLDHVGGDERRRDRIRGDVRCPVAEHDPAD